jgi:transcription termination/antitermination protein NusA
MDEAEISGRIGAQTAKQVIIQKIREAERDSLLGKFGAEIGTMVTGVVTRNEGPATIVSFDGIESILPRSEQIPGETHHPNERVRAVIFEVKPQGSRVKVVLSRTRPQLVQRLFEQEIPEIADGVITIQAIAREPGHRSKVAVSSSDQRVDCVGACVGVRGNRIKNIVDELAGERIDIVRYNEDAETLIRAALQPAEVDQVLLCDMIGRAIVLVREDQLSLAIGRKGQNVRLASKLCGWDIEIMTNEELEQQIERAVGGFMQIDGMNEELAQRLVEQGYLSYDDLSVIEPDALMEMGSMTEEQVNHIVEQAETLAEQAEKAADDERRRKKAEEAAATAAAAAGETVGAASATAPAAIATAPATATSGEASAPAAASESAESSAPPADTAG